MYFNPLFAIEKLKPIDPDITKASVGIMGIALIGLVGFIIWHVTPILYAKYRNKHAEKVKAEKDIWFDAHKSILHRGPHQLTVPENSLEYYVCKLVFKNPTVYQTDLDVLDEAGEENKNDRAVYFAVDRVNNKAKRALKLEDKLLKRNSERTRLNDNYF